MVTNAVSLDHQTGDFTVHPVSLLITDRALICLADVCPALDPARLLATQADRLAEHGVEAAVQVLMSAVVAGTGRSSNGWRPPPTPWPRACSRSDR